MTPKRRNPSNIMSSGEFCYLHCFASEKLELMSFRLCCPYQWKYFGPLSQVYISCIPNLNDRRIKGKSACSQN